MKISEHLDQVKALIETLPSKPTVKLFSGRISLDEIIKQISIDGKRPYILIGCGGGPIPEKNKRVKLECEAIFGAWVVAKTDSNTLGVSKIAADNAVEIAKMIESYRGNAQTNTNLPVLELIEESFNGREVGYDYSAWFVKWNQRIVLV